MRARRVLHLAKGLGRGGAEQLLVNAATYRDRDRFEYRVAYLLPWKDALVEDLRALGVPVHLLGRGRGPAWIGRLQRLVRAHEIDVIHAHSPYAAIGARVAFPAGRGSPHLVCTEHNMWEKYHRATYWANAATFPRNRRVFAVSEGVRSSIRYPAPLRWLPMPPVETLHQGLDPAAVSTWGDPSGVRSELGIRDGAPIVGTVGNFTPQKGHEHLLEAAAIVRRSVPDVRFVLVGQGPHEPAVRRHADRLGLNGSAVFVGFRKDAPRIAGAFDVFTLSSIQEGLSIAMLEAMAMGRPVVVTDVGGAREVVKDGREGILVPPGDPAQLAESLLALLSDADRRRRMGKAARVRAEAFDIRTTVSRYEEVYEELVQ